MLFIFLGSELQQILNDNSAEVDASSSDFWVLVAALKVGASCIASSAWLQIQFVTLGVKNFFFYLIIIIVIIWIILSIYYR